MCRGRSPITISYSLQWGYNDYSGGATLTRVITTSAHACWADLPAGKNEIVAKKDDE